MQHDYLSNEQKQRFFEDGFIVIKDVIPRPFIQTARRLVEGALPSDKRVLLVPRELATHPDILRLFNDTLLKTILETDLGPFPEVISSQVAVTPAFDAMGGTPSPHVDGSWSGPIPESANDIEAGRGRPLDPGPYFGENEDRRGSNDGQLWQDPDRTISLGSYSALVGVALNDQSVPGRGQFAVLKGMHEEVEAAFRFQRDAGGVIGPEGPGWPRIKVTESGRTYLNGLPESVRAHLQMKREHALPIDKWDWPELTPVLLDEGDAVIALHSCPHTPTPNHSGHPRMNIYFRIRRLREGNPHEGSRRLGHGVSDHLDRGYYGQFLDYPSTYDPWKTSVENLCDHWSEWQGMHEIVAAGSSITS